MGNPGWAWATLWAGGGQRLHRCPPAVQAAEGGARVVHARSAGVIHPADLLRSQSQSFRREGEPKARVRARAWLGRGVRANYVKRLENLCGK